MFVIQILATVYHDLVEYVFILVSHNQILVADMFCLRLESQSFISKGKSFNYEVLWYFTCLRF
jgi:hypothetical protein